MGSYRFLVAAAVMLSCGQSEAKKAESKLSESPVCENGVATLLMKPIEVVKETPVLVQGFFPENLEVALDADNTVYVTDAPATINTVVTKTSYERMVESGYATGHDGHKGLEYGHGYGPGHHRHHGCGRHGYRCGPHRDHHHGHGCGKHRGHRCGHHNGHHRPGSQSQNVKVCVQAHAPPGVTCSPSASAKPTPSEPANNGSDNGCKPSGPSGPTCLAGESVLPAACKALATVDAVGLASQVLLCRQALVALNLGTLPIQLDSTLTCLTSSVLSLGASSIVTCLTKALDGLCISVLPSSCPLLRGLEGEKLSAQLAICIADLGIFVSLGNAANCSGRTFKSGEEALICLKTALKLPLGLDVNGEVCLPDEDGGRGAVQPPQPTTRPTVPPKLCLNDVPSACSSIVDLNAVQIAACTKALGTYASGAAGLCLKATVTPVADIAVCIKKALDGVCITELPDSCKNMDTRKKVLIDLQPKLSQCAFDLGPFINVKAEACLSGTTSPSEIAACLQAALFG